MNVLRSKLEFENAQQLSEQNEVAVISMWGNDKGNFNKKSSNDGKHKGEDFAKENTILNVNNYNN